MALTDTKGSVPPRKHKLERSNIENEANAEMAEKRQLRQVDKFPMHVHKAAGLVKLVENEDQLADALDKGWCEDIRDVKVAKRERPDRISKMTVDEAETFVDEHRKDGAKLAELIADEQAHGKRAAVLALLEGAADALGSGEAPAPKKAKAAKAPKKK